MLHLEFPRRSLTFSLKNTLWNFFECESAVGELLAFVYLKMSLSAFINIKGYFLRAEKFTLAVSLFLSTLAISFHFLQTLGIAVVK